MVRALPQSLPEVRQVVLGARSQCSSYWGLIVKHKYSVKVATHAAESTFAASVKASLAWDCVDFGRKPAGKGHVWLSVGSEKPAPHNTLIFGGELVVLKPFKEEIKMETLPSAFALPSPAKEDDRQDGDQFMDAQEVAGESLPEAIRAHCDLSELLKIRWLLDFLSLRPNHSDSG